jgi:hypothetical protein
MINYAICLPTMLVNTDSVLAWAILGTILLPKRLLFAGSHLLSVTIHHGEQMCVAVQL